MDQIVADVIGPNGMTPQEIIEAYPHSNLTLARIHAAMTWYYDHQAEIDAEFERVRQMVEAAREQQRNTPLFQKLTAAKAAREATDSRPAD